MKWKLIALRLRWVYRVHGLLKSVNGRSLSSGEWGWRDVWALARAAAYLAGIQLLHLAIRRRP